MPHCLDPLGSADSWKESWVRGKETPWTRLAGVWCSYAAKHGSQSCTCLNPKPTLKVKCCLDPLGSADSWKESWVRGKETPWTRLAGVWCSYAAKHGSQSCTCLNPKPTLKVKCFREASLRGSKGALSAGAEKTGKGSNRGCPLVLRVCLYGTIQETSEIPSLLTLMGEFPFVSQG